MDHFHLEACPRGDGVLSAAARGAALRRGEGQCRLVHPSALRVSGGRELLNDTTEGRNTKQMFFRKALAVESALFRLLFTARLGRFQKRARSSWFALWKV